MLSRRAVRVLVVASAPGLLALGAISCSAGNYRPAPSYSTAGRGVYGFGANGQSFVYKPAPSVANYGVRASGTNISSPQYRFDSLTAPKTNASMSPRYNSQPHYFSGRLWYPNAY